MLKQNEQDLRHALTRFKERKRKENMADQNNNQQNNTNASGIDKNVDNEVNKGIDSASNRVPEGQKIDQAVKPKADQAVNNELNKGAGGMKNDAENLMGKKE